MNLLETAKVNTKKQTVVNEVISSVNKFDGLVLLNQNTKLKKANKYGKTQLGLELLPHSMGGYSNICTGASRSCKSTCLVLTNNARFKPVMVKRQLRTDLFFTNQELFFKKLCAEIEYNNQLYSNLQIRLNVFSDIFWEDIVIKDGKNIFELFESVLFYDYSKIPKRCYLNIPNYHVVFSGQYDNKHIWTKLLQDGKQVALVFKTVPPTYDSWIVVDGDKSDDLWQWKDQSVIIGLRYKMQTLLGSNNKKLQENNKLIMK